MVYIYTVSRKDKSAKIVICGDYYRKLKPIYKMATRDGLKSAFESKATHAILNQLDDIFTQGYLQDVNLIKYRSSDHLIINAGIRFTKRAKDNH